MEKARVDFQKVRDAVRNFLLHLSRINDSLSRTYKANEYMADLRFQEMYANDWAQKLVKALLEEDSSYLEDYQDSLLELRATRSCLNFLARGEKPLGYKVFADWFEREQHVDLSIVKDSDLSDLAKVLRVEKDDAADFKAAILNGPLDDYISDEMKKAAEVLKTVFTKSVPES